MHAKTSKGLEIVRFCSWCAWKSFLKNFLNLSEKPHLLYYWCVPSSTPLWRIIFHHLSTNIFYRIHLFLFLCIHFIYKNLFLFMIICKNLFLFVIICENHFLFIIICENLFLFMIVCKNLFLFSKIYFYFHLFSLIFTCENLFLYMIICKNLFLPMICLWKSIFVSLYENK